MPRASNGTPSLQDPLNEEDKESTQSTNTANGRTRPSTRPGRAVADVAKHQQGRDYFRNSLGRADSTSYAFSNLPLQRKDDDGHSQYLSPRTERIQKKSLSEPRNCSAKAHRAKSSGVQQEDIEHSLSSSEASMPMPIPYSTAASVLIPGVRSVRAALLSRRRKLYKLWTIGTREDEPPRADLRNVISMAHAARVEVGFVKKHFLDRIAAQLGKQGVPALHDGVILDASPLPLVPVKALGSHSKFDEYFALDLDHQSKEEAEVNGTPNRLSYHSSGWRRPLLIWLHGVVDTGNVGAIARSALYFGADAMILSSRGTGSIAESGTQKSSAGASEFLQTLTVKDPERFIEGSIANGWMFISAVAPPSRFDESSGIQLLDQMTINPVAHDPCVLILGNEDMGLPYSITRLTQSRLSIPGCSMAAMKAGLDSLNVSVAGALLLARFLHEPRRSVPYHEK